MSLDSLPGVKEVIRQHSLRTNRSLGQHFLLDMNLAARIANSAGDLSGITIYEVGPGPGTLTRALLKTDALRVIGVERDERCVKALSDLLKASGDRLRLISGDALSMNEFELTKKPCITVSNLPYVISTQLLIKWMKQNGPFDSYILMFQKEVADRIVATHGNKAYGRLSVFVQWRYTAKILFGVPPSAFSPRPKVDSAIVKLCRRPKAIAPASANSLEIVLRATFGQRRKMLRSSLRSIASDPDSLLTQAGIDGNLRAEDLNVEDYCSLARTHEGTST